MIVFIGIGAIFITVLVLVWRFVGVLPLVISEGGIGLYLDKKFRSLNKPTHFTIRLMGQDMVHIADPAMIDAVLVDSSNHLDSFAAAILPLLWRLFRIPGHLATDPEIGGKSLEASHLLMRGPEIDKMFQRAVEVAQPIIQGVTASGQEQMVDLEFLYRLAFKATVTGVFGVPVADTPGLLEAYRLYDEASPRLAGGMPWWAARGVADAYKLLGSSILETVETTPTRAVALRHEALQKEEAEIVGNFHASFLWVSLANTIPASIWILLHLGRRRDIQDEIYRDILRFNADGDFSRSALQQSDVLEWSLKEVLRLYWGGFSMRSVKAPNGVTLKDRKGNEHHFAHGTLLYGNGSLFHHNDEYFDNPDEFDPHRWRTCQEKIFSFGGGKNMCAGRLFATNEIKFFVASILSKNTVELIGPLPKIDPQKAGFGLSPPIFGETKLLIRPRRVE